VSAREDESDRLRELHETYIWDVNAAVAEGREDLVARLVDDYFDAAVRVMAEELPPVCGRPDCTMCSRPCVTPAPPARPRRWWWPRR
jgi:hypothetical protein